MKFLEGSSSVCAREIELRREIIAAMRLRGSFERRLRLIRPRAQDDSRHSLDTPAKPQAAHSIRILSICDYEGLRVSREWLLNREGYVTESHASGDSLEVVALGSFHIAILCHSVAQEQARRIADTLHRCNREIHVLRICNRFEPAHGRSFDAMLDCFAAPEELLEFIREALLRWTGPRLR